MTIHKKYIFIGFLRNYSGKYFYFEMMETLNINIFAYIKYMQVRTIKKYCSQKQA